MVHWSPESGACRSSPRAGRATFTIVLSRATMSRLVQHTHSTRIRLRRLMGAALVSCPNTTLLSDMTVTWVPGPGVRSEEHTSELQSRENLVCRLLLE